MFFTSASPTPPPSAISKKMGANRKSSLVMIPMSNKTKLAPQSPLLTGQQKQKRRNVAIEKKRKGKIISKSEWTRHRRPITPKITNTPPCQDFYWGKRITSRTKLTPRMISLQSGTYFEHSKMLPITCMYVYFLTSLFLFLSLFLYSLPFSSIWTWLL